MAELTVAIVADDLTGALDAAAPFARCGALTRVAISSERLGAVLSGHALPEVLAINTESRHLPPEQGASRVGRALETVQRLAPRVLIKKIDSTLRGNVVAECLAARQACGRALLIAPAVPEQGRIVRHGQVYVNGEPLAASDYGQDARSAPPVESLPRVFARHGVLVSALPKASDIDSEDCLVDASHRQDLDAIALRLLETPSRWVAVGAAGLAEAIACLCFSAQPVAVKRVPPILFAIGSRCAQAQRQIEQLRLSTTQLTVRYAMEDTGTVGTGQSSGANMLIIPEREPSTRHTAEQVAQCMAEQVVAHLEQAGDHVPLLFLTGGDTAMAIVQRLGVDQIEVAGEWAPGVVWGWLDGRHDRPVITKAGGFGDDTLLVRLLQASTTRG